MTSVTRRGPPEPAGGGDTVAALTSTHATGRMWRLMASLCWYRPAVGREGVVAVVHILTRRRSSLHWCPLLTPRSQPNNLTSYRQ
uniref:Uncharacterized protein n=1 Tax=Timema poppense TaxID=170557 RepID=A0A7R9HDL3_TIMPO|nr:unnamed protein product [Timema poppensis]